MDYHVFKKAITLKSGEVRKRWYYYWVDPVTNVQHQKICVGAKTQSEAYAYIAKLQISEDDKESKLKIKNICKDMFLPESDHVKRLSLLGKNLRPRTLQNHRIFLNQIVSVFGERNLQELTVQKVNGYLMQLSDKSGSWKNSFLETLGFVYKEAQWLTDENIIKPEFSRFSRNSKKADIFTKEELDRFFDGNNCTNYGIREYLLFLITASCGLRLGEARGLRCSQVLEKEHALVIDGFLERDGNRTNYNKKGSEEDTKLRVTIIPDETLNLLMKYIKIKNLKDDDFLRYADNYKRKRINTDYVRAVIGSGYSFWWLRTPSINSVPRRDVPYVVTDSGGIKLHLVNFLNGVVPALVISF